MTDTHRFDGKLVDRIAELRLDTLPRAANLAELRVAVTQSANAAAIASFAAVENGTRAQNFDPSNGLDALELLHIIAAAIARIDIGVLVAQLEEMQSGMCPQGRATRLFQVVHSAVE